MSDDPDTRLVEVERLAQWCRGQLVIHAQNTENAMEKHKASMAAWTEASGKLDEALAEIAALKGQIEKLQAAANVVKS